VNYAFNNVCNGSFFLGLHSACVLTVTSDSCQDSADAGKL